MPQWSEPLRHAWWVRAKVGLRNGAPAKCIQWTIEIYN